MNKKIKIEEINDIQKKELWELFYDFYKNHENKIKLSFLFGNLIFSGYNLYKYIYETKNINNILKEVLNNQKELEIRVADNLRVLKEMDRENSQIKMWFSQTPNIKRKKVKDFKYSI